MKFQKIPNKDLNRLTEEEFKEKKNKTSITIILDNVRSLNNIGSIFRTADAFLIESIVLCGITATPPHRDIFRTALGATDTVDWTYENDILEAIEKLKTKKYKIVGIEQTKNSTLLQEFSANKGDRIAIIFGNEVEGVSQEAINLCDDIIEIPQFGTKHSLNISVSVGIVIWDLFKKINS